MHCVEKTFYRFLHFSLTLSLHKSHQFCRSFLSVQQMLLLKEPLLCQIVAPSFTFVLCDLVCQRSCQMSALSVLCHSVTVCQSVTQREKCSALFQILAANQHLQRLPKNGSILQRLLVFVFHLIKLFTFLLLVYFT